MPDQEDSSHGETILRVAVPRPLRRLFDYLPPAGKEVTRFRPGCRIKVPFGPRELTGFVLETTQSSTVGREQLKPAGALLDCQPLFTPALLGLLRWSADYYHHPIGEVLASAIPSPLRKGAPMYAEADFWTAVSGPEALSARARRQRELLAFICARESVSRAEVRDAGFDPGLLRQLTDKELLRKKTRAAEPAPGFPAWRPGIADRPTLNPEQAAAVGRFRAAGAGFRCALLNGVTGSGKTEVYMRLMEDELAAGRQCLVLVPEIGLTPQTIERFRRRFEMTPAVFHSGLGDAERLAAWRQAAAGGAAVIIGTRSAVFAPMARPGLIVVR